MCTFEWSLFIECSDGIVITLLITIYQNCFFFSWKLKIWVRDWILWGKFEVFKGLLVRFPVFDPTIVLTSTNTPRTVKNPPKTQFFSSKTIELQPKTIQPPNAVSTHQLKNRNNLMAHQRTIQTYHKAEHKRRTAKKLPSNILNFRKIK